METATAMLVNPSAIERVHTGIPGLDHVLEGGFPKGARVLIAGGAGCGKTIYCGQYLYKGATRYGEPGVYVTTEEPPQEFRSNMLRFGWDFKRIEAFLATGVMVLSLVKQGSPLRKVFVRKMRGTSHSLNDFAFSIGRDGVAIKGPIGVRSVSGGRRRPHSSNGRGKR